MQKEYMKIKDKNIILPEYELYKISEKKNKYLVCIPVLNEGEKFVNQLKKMQELKVNTVADIIMCDGGSTDGSADIEMLKKYGVSALVIRKSPGHMSDQLMLGYYYALENGYEGTITIDGNGKDGIDGIFKMVETLDKGYSLIQGSRYVKGGVAINTPKLREIAIKLIHVPVVNKLSGFKYTDTTNGFRAHDIEVFKDTEVPVLRQYTAKGKIPTKISPIKGNIDLIKILWKMFRKEYDPKE